MTHVLLCDERDAETINALGKPALWWPQAVPERFIARDYQCPSRNKAVFYGACYGLRREWLGHPDLKRLLVYPKSPETSTLYPLLFNILHLPFFVSWPSVVPIRQEFFTAYLKRLRHVRERCFKRWLRALQTGHAVVNLPHFVKTYAGRVVEGMAAGRPVVSWEIPDRPQNRALFEDEKEILLFRSDNPDQLVLHLERILGDTALRQRLVVNARKKVLQFHTAQIRVRQILNWVGNGQIPRYS